MIINRNSYIYHILQSLNLANYKPSYWLDWFTTTRDELMPEKDEKGKWRDVIRPVKHDDIFTYVELLIVDILEEFGWPNEWELGKSHLPDSLMRIKTNLCRNNHHIIPKAVLYCTKVMSEQLKIAIAAESRYYRWDEIYMMDKIGLINNNTAKYFTSFFFDSLKYLWREYKDRRFLFGIKWLNLNWISPIGHESKIIDFINQPTYGNWVILENKWILIDSIRRYRSIYNIVAPIYDEMAKKHNTESFNYKLAHDEFDPLSFKGHPLADGSFMKPIKRWFKWRLE